MHNSHISLPFCLMIIGSGDDDDSLLFGFTPTRGHTGLQNLYPHHRSPPSGWRVRRHDARIPYTPLIILRFTRARALNHLPFHIPLAFITPCIFYPKRLLAFAAFIDTERKLMPACPLMHTCFSCCFRLSFTLSRNSL